MQFTKLFNSILDSTIWQEAKETKIVWITMLAMCDRYGDVFASIPGLASRAKVSVPECEQAILCLMSPDPYSRTKDHEGRRIKEIDGGWQLLNHGKYRELLSTAERREYLRLKQQESRAKKRQHSVNNGQQKSTLSTHTEADQRQKQIKPISKKQSNPDFEAFWQAYPRKAGRGKALEAWNKIERPPLETLIKAVQDQSRSKDWTKDDGQFIPHAATWLNQARWEDQLQPTNGTHTKRPLPGQFL